ncbi:hypothetical protein [Caldilinea sp.]|uniref:hypothetical protein n=1 Tax=Caldilinea sp. TaxID=2293560 RepID=UPI002C603443|nr:hypothetical protein [Caldilinea sp.]HRA64831.1 hypothetical protein [Caldilinea sp.]
MARRTSFSGATVQTYPRIQDSDNKQSDLLDDSTLLPHQQQMSLDEMKDLVRRAIINANLKSSRAILNIPDGADQNEIEKICRREGRNLLKYFRKYCGDPAATAHQIYKKTYQKVGVEQFRNRTLQKERMNSGWRYQFLATGCAQASGRFESVSDIGNAECDFNAVIRFQEHKAGHLTLYVSVENRSNTMGGQDWPKAIQAMEVFAKLDKNRTGPYMCVFGIAMERGTRLIRKQAKSGNPYSVNTEIWLSDYFWPFFANYTYEEIMKAVLDVLMESYDSDELVTQVEAPPLLLDAFGEACRTHGLVDDSGVFADPYRLVEFFCKP